MNYSLSKPQDINLLSGQMVPFTSVVKCTMSFWTVAVVTILLLSAVDSMQAQVSLLRRKLKAEVTRTWQRRKAVVENAMNRLRPRPMLA